ncbi:hypothetical protein DMA11_16920 [Marinilabiliaceae bacterium JC017]|nr:hypothetical protein DMA11_16920 [Marinilabiliaceae bacterium JC017]
MNDSLNDPELQINDKCYNKEQLHHLIAEKKNVSIPEWEQSIFSFLEEWLNDDEFVTVNTSGSTGVPKSIKVSKRAMIVSARNTLKFFNLTPGCTALLCLSANYIAGKMMIVRALEGKLNLVICEPAGVPLENLKRPVDFAAMVPLQVYNQLEMDVAAFERVKTVIVGGGRLSESVDNQIANRKVAFWETYGMTETLSHVALRRINGIDKKDHFTALFNVSFSEDVRGCLVIEANGVTVEALITNDLVELMDKRHFRFLGRYDNVINTGGIKVFPETIERKLEKAKVNELVIVPVKDEKLGEKVVLVLEGEENDSIGEVREAFRLLEKYEQPKEVLYCPDFPRTETGKVHRGKLANWAESILIKKK